MKKGVCLLWVVVVLILMVEFHEAAAAATCSPSELAPCLGALTGGQKPSNECCRKLKEQQPCFCQYLKNPAYKQYIDSPNARKVAGICAVSVPKC